MNAWPFRVILRSLAIFAFVCITQIAGAAEKPNVILVLADDISARELPIYDSSVWSKPSGADTTSKDAKFK